MINPQASGPIVYPGLYTEFPDRSMEACDSWKAIDFGNIEDGLGQAVGHKIFSMGVVPITERIEAFGLVCHRGWNHVSDLFWIGFLGTELESGTGNTRSIEKHSRFLVVDVGIVVVVGCHLQFVLLFSMNEFDQSTLFGGGGWGLGKNDPLFGGKTFVLLL